MSLTPPDQVLLEDMLAWVRRARRFVDGVSENDFLHDERTQSAVMHALIVVGEVAARAPERLRDRLPHMPWREIRGMRNRLTHDYLGIDLDEVWRTVTRDLPDLERQLTEAIEHS